MVISWQVQICRKLFLTMFQYMPSCYSNHSINHMFLVIVKLLFKVYKFQAASRLLMKIPPELSIGSMMHQMSQGNFIKLKQKKVISIIQIMFQQILNSQMLMQNNFYELINIFQKMIITECQNSKSKIKSISAQKTLAIIRNRKSCDNICKNYKLINEKNLDRKKIVLNTTLSENQKFDKKFQFYTSTYDHKKNLLELDHLKADSFVKKYHIIDKPEIIVRVSQIIEKNENKIPQAQNPMMSKKNTIINLNTSKSKFNYQIGKRSQLHHQIQFLQKQIKQIQSNEKFSLTEIIQFKQHLFNKYFYIFIASLQNQCKQKANTLTIIWQLMIQLMEKVFTLLIGKIKNQEDKNLQQQKDLHSTYQNCLEKSIEENFLLKKQNMQKQELVDNLIYNLRYKRRQIKKLYGGIKIANEKINEYKEVYLQLQNEHIELQMYSKDISKETAQFLLQRRKAINQQKKKKYKLNLSKKRNKIKITKLLNEEDPLEVKKLKDNLKKNFKILKDQKGKKFIMDDQVDQYIQRVPDREIQQPFLVKDTQYGYIDQATSMEQIVPGKKEIGVGPILEKIPTFQNKYIQVTPNYFSEIVKYHQFTQTNYELKYISRIFQQKILPTNSGVNSPKKQKVIEQYALVPLQYKNKEIKIGKKMKSKDKDQNKQKSERKFKSKQKENENSKNLKDLNKSNNIDNIKSKFNEIIKQQANPLNEKTNQNIENNSQIITTKKFYKTKKNNKFHLNLNDSSNGNKKKLLSKNVEQILQNKIQQNNIIQQQPQKIQYANKKPENSQSNNLKQIIEINLDEAVNTFNNENLEFQSSEKSVQFDIKNQIIKQLSSFRGSSRNSDKKNKAHFESSVADHKINIKNFLPKQINQIIQKSLRNIKSDTIQTTMYRQVKFYKENGIQKLIDRQQLIKSKQQKINTLFGFVYENKQLDNLNNTGAIDKLHYQTLIRTLTDIYNIGYGRIVKKEKILQISEIIYDCFAIGYGNIKSTHVEHKIINFLSLVYHYRNSNSTFEIFSLLSGLSSHTPFKQIICITDFILYLRLFFQLNCAVSQTNLLENAYTTPDKLSNNCCNILIQFIGLIKAKQIYQNIEALISQNKPEPQKSKHNSKNKQNQIKINLDQTLLLIINNILEYRLKIESNINIYLEIVSEENIKIINVESFQFLIRIINVPKLQYLEIVKKFTEECYLNISNMKCMGLEQFSYFCLKNNFPRFDEICQNISVALMSRNVIKQIPFFFEEQREWNKQKQYIQEQLRKSDKWTFIEAKLLNYINNIIENKESDKYQLAQILYQTLLLEILDGQAQKYLLKCIGNNLQNIYSCCLQLCHK